MEEGHGARHQSSVRQKLTRASSSESQRAARSSAKAGRERKSARHADKKAVFPVIGLDASFLRAPRLLPTYMLAILDGTSIWRADDYGATWGRSKIILAAGCDSPATVELFSVAFGLEQTVEVRGERMAALDSNRATPGDIIIVRQRMPLGLGHAILCARAVTRDESDPILLSDEVMVAGRGRVGCRTQMVDVVADLR